MCMCVRVATCLTPRLWDRVENGIIMLIFGVRFGKPIADFTQINNIRLPKISQIWTMSEFSTRIPHRVIASPQIELNVILKDHQLARGTIRIETIFCSHIPTLVEIQRTDNINPRLNGIGTPCTQRKPCRHLLCSRIFKASCLCVGAIQPISIVHFLLHSLECR